MNVGKALARRRLKRAVFAPAGRFSTTRRNKPPCFVAWFRAAALCRAGSASGRRLRSRCYYCRMSVADRLKWTFAILFILCGVPLWFLDAGDPDPSAAAMLPGLAALFLGGFGLCLAWSSWETGTIDLLHFNYSRARQPRRFVAVIALILVAACGTLVTAFWFLFFK